MLPCTLDVASEGKNETVAERKDHSQVIFKIFTNMESRLPFNRINL
jgi:hypothetical protein